MKYNKDRFAGDLLFTALFSVVFYVCLYLAVNAVCTQYAIC